MLEGFYESAGTIADEMLLADQPFEVQDAIKRLYGDEDKWLKHGEQQYASGYDDARREYSDAANRDLIREMREFLQTTLDSKSELAKCEEKLEELEEKYRR